MTNRQILISAGEASGDLYAARLAMALRARGHTGLFGLGGPRMREAGVQVVADQSEVAVIGISEVVRRLPALRQTMRRLVEEVERRKPALAILVDFPGFHMRLARKLRRRGIRNVYFVCPQFWAWRPWRVRQVKRRFARALCIFPFEEKFYREAGVAVNFVGHPLVDLVRAERSSAEFAGVFQLDSAKPIVTILPGSRSSELTHHMPTLARACRLLNQRMPCQFVLALAPGLARAELAPYLDRALPLRVVEGATYDALAAADAAVVSSGTATVEAALLGIPMVIVYRVSRFTAALAGPLVRTPFYGMPNLIAGRRIVPELIQDDFTAQRVADEVERLLSSAEAREEMKRNLAEVRSKLGPGGAIERAADIIAEML